MDNPQFIKSRTMLAMESYTTHYSTTIDKWLKLKAEARDTKSILYRDIRKLSLK